MAKKELTTAVGETRKFKMHPDLLFSVIQSQAGTAEKALLEAVMNAVDAGATQCVVNVDDAGYTIEDDGKGFASRKEIDEFFETFGTPHKEGDATYGKFRMGRGQLFAFSSTKWRTNEFEMDVDIKKTGLDYVLKEGMKVFNGCKISGKWYEKMQSNHLFNTLKELERLIRYMQIPIIVNGNVVNINPEKQKWDYKENDFFIKVSDSASVLSVYNMGALVSHYPASKFGVAGTVVTRSALKVNFARNDVLVSQCPMWKKIEKKMAEVMGNETKGKVALKGYERQAILNAVISKKSFIGDFMKEGLIETVSGKKLSFKTLLQSTKLTISTGDTSNKRLEERVNDSKMAVVLNRYVLDIFDCEDTKSFVKKINDLINYNNKHFNAEVEKLKLSGSRNYYEFYNRVVRENFKPVIADIDDMLKNMKKDSSIKDESELSKKEKAFLKALNTLSEQMARGITQKQMDEEDDNSYQKYEESYQNNLRKVMIGVSETAQAWTDGYTYIVFDEKMIKSSAYNVVHVMLHEYCHNEETLQSHVHGIDFYELYHNISFSDENNFVTNCLAVYQKAFNREMINAGVKPKIQFDTDLEIMEKSSEISKSMKMAI